MSLACPKCGMALGVSRMRSHFACPGCAVKLKGNATGPSIAGIALWIMADLIIYPLVYSNLGNTTLVHAVRIGISGCIGIPLVLVLIGTFGTVTFDGPEEGKES